MSFLSLASVWEMAIKIRLGKFDLQQPLAEFIHQQLERNQIELLPIGLGHIVQTMALPFHHRDPFDRLLEAHPSSARPSFNLSDIFGNIMSYLQRITVNPLQCGGRPCIRGMRIRVKDVLDLLAAGASRMEILEDYPYLEDEDITAVLEYAASQFDHPVLKVA